MSRKRETFKDIKRYPEALEKLKDIFSSDINSRFGKPLSVSTITNYTGKMDRLSILCLGHGWNGNDDWLLKPEKVLKSVDNSTLTSKKDYISGVVKYLRHKKADEDIIKKYLTGMGDFKTAEYSKRKDNLATEKQVDNSLPLSEIKAKINAYKPSDEMGVVNKLICSLYFQNTLVPRREDLTLLKYVSTSKKPKDMNKMFNYVTIDKNGNPVDIVMNFYKSRNTYGENVKFPLSEETKKIFKDYIKLTNGKNGDFVFLSNNKDVNGAQKPFTPQNWSDVILGATKEILGKPMTSNLMRKIQITDYLKDGLRSANEDDLHAKKFLHSTAMQKEYLATNLKMSDDDE